jgi:Ion transport protein
MPTPAELPPAAVTCPTTYATTMASDESTPLLGAAPAAAAAAATATKAADPNTNRKSTRQWVFEFLTRQTSAGKWYEKLMIALILSNVLAFVLSTCFVEKYVGPEQAARCGPTCDWLWFGNHSTTSLLEVVTILVFTADYLANMWTADLDNPKYSGMAGRVRYFVSFFSLVDLASTIPFYVDLLTPNRDLVNSSWVRMLRLLRMMSVEGRYDTALTLVDDVYVRQKGVLGTALFVGFTVWMSVASLYYLAERHNLEMVYCPTCEDVDTSKCTIDEWGFANCTEAGCEGDSSDPYPCYNLYESIVMACYYALLNLFGEFPLALQHSVGGQVVGTLTAVVAVAVFALPAGIIGNGFESVIAEKTAAAIETAADQVGQVVADVLSPSSSSSEAKAKGATTAAPPKEKSLAPVELGLPRPSLRLQRLYDFWHLQSTPLASWVDHGTHLCTAGILITFCLQTTTKVSHWNVMFAGAVDAFNLLATAVFALDYVMKVISSAAAPPSVYKSRVDYATRFMPMVDLVTFVPYVGSVVVHGASAIFPLANRVLHHKKSGALMDESNWIAAFRLFRILRWEKYTAAFGTFDAVLKSNLDVLTITAATAALLWVLFGSLLYFTERDNPDSEMASNYSTIPNAMWITLLNLSGTHCMRLTCDACIRAPYLTPRSPWLGVLYFSNRGITIVPVLWARQDSDGDSRSFCHSVRV